jgi:hypothetical protein
MGEGQDERVNQGKRKKNKALSHQEKKSRASGRREIRILS